MKIFKKKNSKKTVQNLDIHQLEEIYRLISEVYDDSKAPIGGGWTEPQVQQELEKRLCLALRDSNGELRSLVIYENKQECFEISILATLPKYQRQGDMRLLMDLLMKKAQEHFKCIWLEVHRQNRPALSLYFDLGFRETGQRHAYYRDGGDAVLLEWAPVVKE